ncbi:MAG: bifunctional aldolase/short-chain dehydrogenase [Proteobacteria bacterium]|nr:MAG: bifunctional aldolase/short-chain dehydrogenase [Pseudomonadota bacterium]
MARAAGPAMRSRWSDADARAAVERWGGVCGEDVALRLYTSRLLGADPALVLHGGGNTSVKTTRENALGEKVAALWVKASGADLASLEPSGLACLDLAWLLRLRALGRLSDAAMVNELRTHLFDASDGTPSIEALVHAWIPARFVDHTHADAILALTNQRGGEALVREALGDDVLVLPYVKAGFALAKASADAFERRSDARAMVLMKHGVITWGESARESYERMLAVVADAERFVAARATRRLRAAHATPIEQARARAARAAPLLRGLLATPSGDADRPFQRVVVRALVEPEALAFADAENARALALSPTVTSDHLIRTKALPAFVEAPAWDDAERLREQLTAAVGAYERDYAAYVERHRARLPAGVAPADAKPRVVVLPGLGALCAGPDVRAADVARDITRQTLAVKTAIAAMGEYEGLPEQDLFDMEFYSLQQAKLAGARPRLAREVALVTGAAGAIGAGIARGLLREGCHVVATDLAGERLDALLAELRGEFGERVAGAGLDVADAESVAAGFAAACAAFGGVDLVVINAGLAHVAPLADLELEAFRRLERVNVEGTLLLLREAQRLFAAQRTGGDVVLVSTKNVFAPGASFGAYSATKAASHQLARIASLELAPLGVRVNMVAPDAVFSDGARKSGLWQEVGPERMKARGLDERGLEEYYRERNLLKARVTAEHVANAVIFLATRQTPTTGATIPVDGGLPDATPR